MRKSAAVAADIAIDKRIDVQDVPYEMLRERLLDLGQVLELPDALGETATSGIPQ